MRQSTRRAVALLQRFYLVSTWQLAVAGATMIDWSSLNRSTNGRLHQAVPFARPCFRDVQVFGGYFDQQECSQVQVEYTNRELRADTFAAYMNTQWETCQTTSEQCLLDAVQPMNYEAFEEPRTCDQGSIPGFYIDVRNASDIVAAFSFSRESGTPLVITNTGHDYVGRSSGPGTLALWASTRNLQNLAYDANFVATGCPASAGQAVVTIGAGVSIDALYAFADAHNITVPAGNDPTVGVAGGYFQGGGHSTVSNAFGLMVDRVLQVEIVVPTGEILIANDCQNSELFFALRGGGGGTFGVVLNITTFALPRLTLLTISGSFENSAENQQKFMAFMVANAVELAKQGWGGYITPASGLLYTNPLLNASTANSSIQGLRNLFDALQGNLSFSVHPSWLSFYNSMVEPNDVLGVPVGVPFAVSSRLIPQETFETQDRRAELVDKLQSVTSNAQLTIIFSVTPFLHGNRGKTSINPVWYSSIWHVTTSAFWNFNTTFKNRQEIYRGLSTGMDSLRSMTSESGAYQNEADVYEPDHTKSYWGSNHDKLAEIKSKYDPYNLLDCWHCGKLAETHKRRDLTLIPSHKLGQEVHLILGFDVICQNLSYETSRRAILKKTVEL